MKYMKENNRILGIGRATVDYKIGGESLFDTFNIQIAEGNPSEIETIGNKQISVHPGGVTPNIISAYVNYSPGNSMRLLASIGEDNRGSFYASKTEVQLGKLQVIKNCSTGYVILALNRNGITTKIDARDDADLRLDIPREEINQANSLIITDLMTLGVERIFSQTEAMFSKPDSSGGKLALNLGGAHPRFGEKRRIQSIVHALKRDPDFVFGNISEYEFLSTMDKPFTAKDIQTIFPNSKLLVVTISEQGALVRFLGEILRINPVRLNPERVRDEVGAGDCFEGIMLAYLCSKPYHEWDMKHISKAGQTAAFAASLVIKTNRSRLNHADIEQVKKYASGL